MFDEAMEQLKELEIPEVTYSLERIEPLFDNVLLELEEAMNNLMSESSSQKP